MDVIKQFKSRHFSTERDFYDYMAYVFFCGKEKKCIEMLYELSQGRQGLPDNTARNDLDELCHEWYKLGVKT